MSVHCYVFFLEGRKSLICMPIPKTKLGIFMIRCRSATFKFNVLCISTTTS